MYYTISDFYNTYKDSMRMLCGKGGLSRRVSSVGILDYEFLPEVRGKYRHYNFDENQLVVSTMLYAREDPAMVADAVKDLINAGTSGLVIKDIFRIRIPETISRYAEARNFPIFIFDTKEPFIENLIYDVKTGILRMESSDRITRELDIITSQGISEQDVYDHAKLINPSFETQHRAYYMIAKDMIGEESVSENFRKYSGSIFDIPESFFASYKGGLLYITSWEHRAGLTDDEIIETMIKQFGSSSSSVGVSDTHYYLGELGVSINESVYSALLGMELSQTKTPYSDMGLMRIVFPLSDRPEMQKYSSAILDPIRDFDLENNGHLIETLETWSKEGMNFTKASKVLLQHENTLRYRMDKIAQLTGLDFKKGADAEELNLAYLISYCSKLKMLSR